MMQMGNAKTFDDFVTKQNITKIDEMTLAIAAWNAAIESADVVMESSEGHDYGLKEMLGVRA